MDITISIPTDPAFTALQAKVDAIGEQIRLLTIPADSPAFTAAVAAWKQNMLTYGAQVAALLADPNQADAIKREATYYDGTRVFMTIWAVTGDDGHSQWLDAAKLAHTYYREYIDENQGRIAGRWLFPYGLHVVGDDETIKLLALNAENAHPLQVLSWTISAHASREVAYMTETKLLAVQLGQAVEGLEEQAQQMFGHLSQWQQSLSGVPMTGIPEGQVVDNYCRPFMAALTTYALVEWAGTDATRLTAILAVLEPFWEKCWSVCYLPQQPVQNNPGLGLCDTMAYTNIEASDGSGGRQPAHDLNLLIAPVYAWLYKQTKHLTYRDRHDSLFIGGVKGAYLEPKQFNQNYLHSSQGIEWRNG